MKSLNINSKKGFTIIEVVLVLAIAGLIFLMVFIALPNMQRSQRDTQRRQDYAALSSNITNFITNNNGKLPAEAKTGGNIVFDAKKYINTDGTDPRGIVYELKATDLNVNGTSVTELNALDSATYTKVQVFIYSHADCTGTTADGRAKPNKNTRGRQFAVYGQLETGTYCQDSE